MASSEAICHCFKGEYMKKIGISDFCKYHFLSSLNASKNALFFIDTKVKEDKSDYCQRLLKYDLNTNSQSVVKDYVDKLPLYYVDENEVLIGEVNKETKKTETKIIVLDPMSGEEMRSFVLPLDVNEIKKYDNNHYLASATFKVNHPDYYKYSEDKKEELIKEEDNNKDYIVLDEYPFVFNGAGVINGNRNGLFIIDKITLEIERITPPTLDVESFDYKENKILMSGVDFTTYKKKFGSVYEYDVLSKTIQKLSDETMIITRSFYLNDDIIVIASFGKETGWLENPKFYKLIDGKCQLYIDSDLSLYNTVGTDIHYGKYSQFRKINGNPYFLSASKGSRSELFTIDNDKLVCLSDFEGTVDDAVVVDNKIYRITTLANRLQEVEVLNGETLTHLNDLSEYYVAKPNRITLNKKTKIQGWVLLPEDFDTNKKYPAILDIHGGPKCAYGEIFYHEMQYWVSLGYIVFFCNPRGGDGRGNDFADLRRQWGGKDFEDLMDFTDEVLRQYPQIDSNRVGVTGGSYGGYMTNWIVSHTNRFKCAATQRSISNMITEVCASDYGIDFPYEMNFTDLHNCHDELWSMSPLKYANNVKTPLLFIHSIEDYRCTLPEALQYFTAIRCNGIDTKIVAFKGENHELSRSGKPLHRIKRLEEITAWMNKYLMEEE